MIDKKGNICEYDGYQLPKQGEDTLETQKIREKAMEEFKKKAEALVKASSNE